MANRLIELPLQFENPASAFTRFQGTSGTTVTADSADDTATFDNSDGAVEIYTDASTDTIDITLVPSVVGPLIQEYITGPLRLAWGSAAFPAYSFNSGEFDSGMYLFDSSRLGWTINGGLDDMFLSANGLGIGTQLPGCRLHTYQLTNSASQIYIQSGDSTEASIAFRNTVKPYSMGVNAAGNFVVAYYPNSISTGVKLTMTDAGNLTMAGTITGTSLTGTGLTSGSALFAGSGGLVSQDNTNWFWDNSAKRMRIYASSFTSSTAKLEIKAIDDLAATDILACYANNLTQGFAIRYSGLAAIGSNTNVDIQFTPKGSGGCILNGGITVPGSNNNTLSGLRINGTDAGNTIYNASTGIAITTNAGGQGCSVGHSDGHFSAYSTPKFDGFYYTATFQDQSTMAAGVGAGLAFVGSYGPGPATFSGIKGLKKNSTSSDFAGELGFYTRINGGSITERVRIDDAGLVGIGTSTPTTYLDINGNKFRVRTAKTPSSATDTGDAGDICWDTGYIYVCTATNTWERVALATW